MRATRERRAVTGMSQVEGDGHRKRAEEGALCGLVAVVNARMQDAKVPQRGCQYTYLVELAKYGESAARRVPALLERKM